MSHPRVYLSPPHIGAAERAFVQEAFDTNWIAPVGPHVDAFGRKLAEAVGASHAVALSSGTAALRPGITGPATLAFRDEEQLLAKEPDPDAYNDEVLYPRKVAINRRYIEAYSFFSDLRYIFRTVFGN